MIDFNVRSKELSEDVDSVIQWCEDVYMNTFSQYFEDVTSLFKRMQSSKHPITDEELENILTNVTLKMFAVSEALSKLKISQEVIKMKTRQKEVEFATKTSKATTVSMRQAEAADAVAEDKLLISAYSKIIGRVEEEITFSRELIMSAKKIWDRRRSSETANPIGTGITGQLPDYTPAASKQSYIR